MLTLLIQVRGKIVETHNNDVLCYSSQRWPEKISEQSAKPVPVIASKHPRQTNIYLITHASQDKWIPGRIPPSAILDLSSISSMLKSYPQYSLVNSEPKTIIKPSQICRYSFYRWRVNIIPNATRWSEVKIIKNKQIKLGTLSILWDIKQKLHFNK